MPVTIDGSNTPTAGGVVYGDGTEYASTTAGTSGQSLLSAGSSAPTWGTPASATTATNLAGGSAGTVPYQSAAGTTQMLAAGTSGQVLQSNGASAPSWTTISAGNFGTDVSFADYTLTMSSALNSATSQPVFMQAIALDGTSELMIFSGAASAHVVVWNSSTNTFGTPVLLRTTTGLNASWTTGAIAISATSVLVCSLPYSTTALETVVLTISGSTITVGTPVATTLSAASSLVSPNTRLVAVGSSYVLTYSNTTGQTPKFRAITVSGTTPTVGAELAYAGGNNLNYTHSYAHSSSLLVNFSASATNLYVYPISVSGTTLTGGTAATASASNATFCTGLLSTGRYAVLYLNATARGAVVTITGTTASISTSATTTAVSNWLPVMQVFSDQALFSTGQALADRLNVITDTSGTATVGTSVAMPFTGLMVGYLASGKVLLAASAGGTTSYAQYGISSGSPVQEKLFQTTSDSTYVTTYTFSTVTYAPPMAGPPNSANYGYTPILRTTAGKTAPSLSGLFPFSISIDGTSPAKLQQGYCPYSYVFSDALSTAVAWGTVNAVSATTTTVQIRKVTLV